MLEHFTPLPQKQGWWMMLLLFFQGATRRNKLICKFQLPGCLIFHTTNASAIVEIEVIVDKGSWLYVQIYIYIHTVDMPSVYRSLDLFFRWLFSFLPFTKSTMVNHYGSTICKSKENIFMKSTPQTPGIPPWSVSFSFQEKLPRRPSASSSFAGVWLEGDIFSMTFH